MQSNPLEIEGYLEQVTQECIQVRLEYPQTGRTHGLPGPQALFSASSKHLTSKAVWNTYDDFQITSVGF